MNSSMTASGPLKYVSLPSRRNEPRDKTPCCVGCIKPIPLFAEQEIRMIIAKRALIEVASHFSPAAQTAIMAQNDDLEDQYPEDTDESTVADARRAHAALEAFLESHAQGAPD